jgi:hypothetical protein
VLIESARMEYKDAHVGDWLGCRERACSVLSLHTLTPWTVHGRGDVVVPEFSDGAAVADLAVHRVGLDQRCSSDYARIPLGPAMAAGQ